METLARTQRVLQASVGESCMWGVLCAMIVIPLEVIHSSAGLISSNRCYALHVAAGDQCSMMRICVS